MDESILATIKKMLGLDADYTPFDMDVIVHINSAILVLQQLGVGPDYGFAISGYAETWGNYLTNEAMLGSVQSYIYLQVKRLFDPPSNSFVMDAIKQQIEELGWRLNAQAESMKDFAFMKDSESSQIRKES